MKLKHLFIKQFKVIAMFGDAQLIQTLDHKFKLQGGSVSDHIEAREWISMFLHDVVVEMPGRIHEPGDKVGQVSSFDSPGRPDDMGRR